MAAVGDILTAGSYQWMRDGTPIAGATDATYTVTAADMNHTISVALTTVPVLVQGGTVANNMVAFGGDSRIWRIDGDARATGGWMHHCGIMLWARRYTGGQVQFNRAHNFAVAGSTTQDLINNQLPGLVASDAASVVLLTGLNDHFGGVTQAQSLANIDQITSALLDAGKAVFFCDETPTNEPASAYPQHTAIRDHIRSLTGVQVVPSWDAIAVTPDSTSPPPYTEDGTHFGPRNASDIGLVLADAMMPVLPAFDLFGRPGIISGGDYTGAGGAKAGGVTGTVPNGWTVALEAGTGTVTAAVQQQDGLNWLVVTLVNGNAPKIGVYTGNLAVGWQTGDRIDMAAKCRVDTGSQNIICCQLLSRGNPTDSSSVLKLANGNPAYDGAIIGDTTTTLPDYAMDMTLWLPHVLAPVSFNQRFEIRGLTGTVSSGTFRFALPQLRKYTGTLGD